MLTSRPTVVLQIHLAEQDTHRVVAAASYQRDSPATTSVEVAEVFEAAGMVGVQTATAAAQTARVAAGRMGMAVVRTVRVAD